MPIVPFTKPPPSSSGNDLNPAGVATDPFTLMAAAQMHSEGRLVEPATMPKERFDDKGNIIIRQAERPLYSKGDPTKGDYYEGPMKLTPGSKADSKAMGFER